MTSNRRRWSHIFPESKHQPNLTEISMNTNVIYYYFLELPEVRKSYDDFVFDGNAKMNMYDKDHINVLRTQICM